MGKNEEVNDMTGSRTPARAGGHDRREQRLRGHRALAGESRVRVLEALRRSGSATVPELSEVVALAPNTVRLHLDQLVDAALVVRERAEPSGRGRPRLVYTAVADADVTEGAYRELARLLAETLASVGPAAEGAAMRTGRTWGTELVAQNPDADVPPAGSTNGSTNAGKTNDSSRDEGRGQVVALMDDLGFEPRLSDGGDVIEMFHCPFHQVAQQHSDVVCGLHLGLMQGALQQLGSAVRATRLEPFATPRMCLAHLGAGPPAERVGAA
jgi:predicted ArsR family transcriptional regulator